MTINTSAQGSFGEKTDWSTLIPSQVLSADARFGGQGGRSDGLMISIAVTAAAALSFTPRIETVDRFGNVIILWAATAAVVANGVVTYVFGPNVADMNGAGITQKSAVTFPREWQLFLDFTAGSATFASSFCYL